MENRIAVDRVTEVRLARGNLTNIAEAEDLEAAEW